LGFVLGIFVVLTATGLALYVQRLPLTLDSIVQLHLSEPVLWVVDAIPFLAAIIFGIVGGRLDNAAHNRWLAQRAIQQRDQEIQRLNGEVAAQEEAREKLDSTTGRGKRDWEATFDAVGDMVLITDVSGKILRCNRATSHAFQEGFENLIGQPIDELFFGPAREGQFTVPSQRVEKRFPKLDGWYEVSTNPIMIEEGRAATIYVIRDTTSYKQANLDLSRQKEYYEALVRNSPFAIVTLNLDQRVVACNPAFESIFGYSEMDVLGQELDALVSPAELVTESRALTETVKHGEVVHKLTRRLKKDGTQVDVEIYGIPVVLWGKQIGILALYHDISQLVAQPVPIPVTTEEPAVAEPEVEAVPAFSVEEPVEAPEKRPSPRAIPIVNIEGIGPAYASRLNEVEIETTADLLVAGGTRKGRQDLSEKTGLSQKLVMRWVNIADLMRIPGIGEQYSELLEAAGVDTVKELRHRVPENLHKAILDVNEEKNLVRRPPHLSEVQSWVQAAKEIETIVEY
jgi:PAS domain S-box-containing protein